MTVTISVPGRADIGLEQLLLDVNGTLTVSGRLVDGVRPRIDRLAALLDIRLLSADTFGALDDVSASLGDPPVHRVVAGADKAALASDLGALTCAAIGNGANDKAMLDTVALGIGVLGCEGAAPGTLAAADVVATSSLDALDLLLGPKALIATLRG